MICAYCKKDKVSTKEHIISDSILELFPECDLTIDTFRNKQYKADPIIKDVCSDCNNNRISYIDEYAKKTISKYFMNNFKSQDTLEFEYEYNTLLKVLMKYTYNGLRSHNDDVTVFDQESLEFLLDKEQISLNKYISILGGLWVNTSPMPEFIFGNQKLQWGKNPIFLENSIISNYNYDTGQVLLRDENKAMDFDGLTLSYFFRFNSGLFIILFWDNYESQKKYEQILPHLYPYALLSPECKKVELVRCTHAYNCHKPNLVDVNWGIGIADSTNGMVRTDVNPVEIQEVWNEEWKEHEKDVRKKDKKK